MRNHSAKEEGAVNCRRERPGARIDGSDILDKLMRRSTSIVLLALFSYLLIAPLSASDSNLPACCRRNGKHHCAMRSALDQWSTRRVISSITEKCPYAPLDTIAAHEEHHRPSPPWLFFAQLAGHPAEIPQTQALGRTSFHRVRQKRGPPTQILQALRLRHYFPRNMV